MPTGRTTGGNPRPVFGVDLVSNSDRMLLAHRRNHHQAITLTQRLDTMDMKCQRSLDRMREDIRQIYFTEQLPREFEVLEIEARRRREECLSLQGRRVVVFSQSLTDGVFDEASNSETAEEQLRLPVIQVDYSPSVRSPTPHGGSSYRGDLQSVSISELHQPKDSLPVPVHAEGFKPEVAARIDGLRSVSGLEGSVYSREPSMMTPWRRPSMLQRRESSATFESNGRHRRKSKEEELEEEEAKPQKSPEEVMAAVRAVYGKTPMSKRNPRPHFWQKLIPPHLTSARLEVPPRPPPSQIRSQAKERLDAFLARLQEKYRQEEGVSHMLPGGEDAGEEELVDFTDAKWKPYKILLEQSRAIYSRPRQMTLPERAKTSMTSMTSHTVIPEAETTARFYRNGIINGDDDGDVSGAETSMSSVISKSRPQSRSLYSA